VLERSLIRYRLRASRRNAGGRRTAQVAGPRAKVAARRLL